MKKSVAIMIAIIFVGAILSINLFGLKASVYNETFNVTKIECINKAEDGTTIGSLLYPVNGGPIAEWENIPKIEIKYEGPADVENNTGTMFFIQTRVYPDNATDKRLKFINYSNSADAELFAPNGEENGLILFHNKGSIIVKIVPAEKNNLTSLFVMVIAK